MAVIVATAGEGAVLPFMTGEHIGSGHVLLNRTNDPRALLMALGDGPWSKAKFVKYKGEDLPSAHWHFHPGTVSSGFTDPVQGRPFFFPGGLTLSRTAYLEARIPGTDEPDPSELIGRYETALLPDYDESGAELGISYSANPARVAAFFILKQARLAARRVDWVSWKAWRDYCDGLIEWNDGKEVRQIKRFEAHLSFSGPLPLTDALNILTDISATIWQDDGTKLLFFPPVARPSAYTFNESNIVNETLEITTVDLRQAPTRLRINFRDLRSELLAPAYWEAKLPDSIIDRRGIIDAGALEYGPMHYSQAQRISKYRLRRLSAYPLRASFEARGDTFMLVPGDPVTMSHPAFGDLTAGEVLEAEDLADGSGDRHFLIGLRREPFYSDTDHEPVPELLDSNL